LDSSTANLNLAVEQRPSNTQHSHEEDIEQPIILDSSGLIGILSCLPVEVEPGRDV
jgi:hypothetical protein